MVALASIAIDSLLGPGTAPLDRMTERCPGHPRRAVA